MSLSMPTRRLVSQNDSAMIARPDVPRSRFTGSWTRKTTFDAGYLVPFLVEEVLPGDHLSYDVTAYIRMATPLFPMFDNQRVDTFFFFIPNRLVWDNWAKFMGEQDSPGDSINYTVPIAPCLTGGPPLHTLWDHFGLPTAGQIPPGGTYTVSALPFRAYYLVWNQWFRDQNVMNGETVPKGNGPDGWNGTLKRRAKSHDYFTSALPWPQKFTAPNIPLTGNAAVMGLGVISQNSPNAAQAVYDAMGGPVTYHSWKAVWDADPSVGGVAMQMTDDTGGVPLVYADLSTVTGVAINTFRQAFLVQQLLERDARGGTRYTELIRAHFGVTNPDFRLQRPEYIGGGQSPLTLTPIAQTAPSTGVPVGALGAAGTAVGQHKASYAATEHGIILGLVNIRSELSYQQGIPRWLQKFSRYDFYWPSLAGLGEQAIYRQEIYAVGNASVDDDLAVFGYQERWHEYRTRYSEVTGLFRSTESGTLDAWHLAQRFSSAPTLSTTFLEDNPPMARVLAAGDLAVGQQYLADIEIHRTAVRPIPMYGTPVTLGRF